MSLANEAQQFLRTTQSGLLSTFSAKFPGYPYGSVTPFVLDHTGQPVILISTLAEHTHNIIANPKLSLLVFAGDQDLQANARLTLMGHAEKIDKRDAQFSARYLRYLPNASSYFSMHDFNFYRIVIAQARYIAGFGKMGWLDGGLISNTHDNAALAEQETAIVEHMNKDHQHSLIAYCWHTHGLKADKANLLGIDCDGFDVCAEMASGKPQRLRFNFDQAVSDAHSARAAFISLSKVAQA